ncbi:hypothetical protein HYV80_00800 [Candidatus Woesearchaeota archaeon]|nr:hypothetical protein [Candidatus Woesearchaeota archaeon]
MLKTEQLISLGVFLIVVGFIIVFIGAFLGAKDSNSKTKVAIGGFIGFIPFGFGNDKKLVWLVAILSSALLIIWVLFSFRIWK